MSEGFDYSSTGNDDWNALANAMRAEKGNVGEIPVGRYCVNDKAPNGRGISADEYGVLAARGFGVFVFWESTEGWMLGGFPAGVEAAKNGQANLLNANMPARQPIIFACDFDATEEQQAAIDDCLRGCASVIGLERTGLYAGYYPLQRAMQNKTATWFVQTSAWSGGLVLPGIHAYQYAYNQWVGGTNMDLVRAYQDNYGQASKFIAEPFAAAILPPTFAQELAKKTPTTILWDWEGQTLHLRPAVQNLKLARDTNQYRSPKIEAEGHAGRLLKKDEKVPNLYTVTVKEADGGERDWDLTQAGTWIPEDATTVDVEVEPRKRGKKA